VEPLHSKTPGGASSTPKLQTQIELFGYQLHSPLWVPPLSLLFLFFPNSGSTRSRGWRPWPRSRGWRRPLPGLLAALLSSAADGVPLHRRRFHDAPRPARAGAEHGGGGEREGGQGSRARRPSRRAGRDHERGGRGGLRGEPASSQQAAWWPSRRGGLRGGRAGVREHGVLALLEPPHGRPRDEALVDLVGRGEGELAAAFGRRSMRVAAGRGTELANRVGKRSRWSSLCEEIE
jgi:hypothetical protein